MSWNVQVDYFERAKRLEEIPMLQKFYDEERQQMKQVWEQQEQERVSNISVTRSPFNQRQTTLWALGL